jgi:hypothetical protein
VLNHRRYVALVSASAAAVGLVSAACGGGTSSSTTTATSACHTAYEAWANGPHGTAAFKQISTDVGIATADLQEVASSHNAPSAVTLTFNAGSKLGVDSDHAAANLPPSCVPGLAAPYHAALSDARQAGIDIKAAMTALRTGNQSAADSSVNAFASDVGDAQLNIRSAQTAVNKLKNSAG